MKRSGLGLALIGVLAMLGLTMNLGGQTMSPTSAPAASPSGGQIEAVYKSVIDWFDAYQAGKGLADMTPVAEKIADRLIAGGKFYVAGDPAFADELNFRAGGLGGVTVWTDQKLTDKDVLVIGLLDPSSKGARYLAPSWIGQNRGNLTPALTVHIASHQWPQAAKLAQIVEPAQWRSGLYFLDTGAPAGGSWPAVATGQIATQAVAGVLQAEIDAAITRKGKTPAVLASIYDKGGPEYDSKIRGKNVIDEPKLEPIPAGKLGKEYLQNTRDILASHLKPDIVKPLHEGARRIAQCQMSKGTILVVGSVHVLARGLVVPPAMTQVFVYGPDYQWEAPRGLDKSDMLLFFGYVEYPQEVVDATAKAGAEVVVVSGKPTTAPSEGAPVVWIPAGWQADSTVEIPGYPYKALAISGIGESLQWYAMMAQAEAICQAGNPAAPR